MMIFRRLQRVRALAAGLMAVALSLSGLGGLGAARPRADREIRVPLAAAHFEAVASARVLTATLAPTQRTSRPTAHTPLVAAMAAARGAFPRQAPRLGPALDVAARLPLPRRQAFSYDATAPPAAL